MGEALIKMWKPASVRWNDWIYFSCSLPQEYDTFGWWVGEMKGVIGIVPKSYLTELYILWRPYCKYVSHNIYTVVLQYWKHLNYLYFTDTSLKYNSHFVILLGSSEVPLILPRWGNSFCVNSSVFLASMLDLNMFCLKKKVCIKLLFSKLIKWWKITKNDKWIMFASWIVFEWCRKTMLVKFTNCYIKHTAIKKIKLVKLLVSIFWSYIFNVDKYDRIPVQWRIHVAASRWQEWLSYLITCASGCLFLCMISDLIKTILPFCSSVLLCANTRMEGFDLFMLKHTNKSKSSYLAAGLIVSCLAYWIVSSWFMCATALTSTERLATEVKNLIKNMSQTITYSECSRLSCLY